MYTDSISLKVEFSIKLVLNLNQQIVENLIVFQGHTCSLVRRTITVRSVKDFPLVSITVWSNGSKFGSTDHQNRPEQVSFWIKRELTEILEDGSYCENITTYDLLHFTVNFDNLTQKEFYLLCLCTLTWELRRIKIILMDFVYVV